MILRRKNNSKGKTGTQDIFVTPLDCINYEANRKTTTIIKPMENKIKKKSPQIIFLEEQLT